MAKKIFDNKLLIIILLIAAFLRLYKIPSYMEFLGDQGRDMLLVRRFLAKGDLMFIGPQTSVGNIYLGPWYYYLIAPALLLSGFNPVGPAIFIALLGVAAVWLVYRVGREWLNKTTGLIAALLMAFSPVIIYYNIFSWNPNVMGFFALLAIYLLGEIWLKKDFKKIPWLALSLAMILNSHYLGLLVFPVVSLFLFLSFWAIKDNGKEKKLLGKNIVWAGIVFFLFMLPLVLFDLKHGGANFQAFKAFFINREETVNFRLYKGISNFLQVLGQLGANLLVRKDSWPWSFLFLPFLLIGLWQARKNKLLLLPGAWLFVGLFGLSNYKQAVYAHYFGFLWPAVILILAVGLKKLWPWSLGAAGIVSLLMFSQWHGLRPPVNQLARSQNVAQFILSSAAEEEFSLALIAKNNYDAPYRYYLENQNPRLVDLHEQMTSQLFVICEPWGIEDCNPLGHSRWEIAAFGRADLAGKWQISGIDVFKLVHSHEKID
ncbi:MAG: glycosyltransferase family 39 protein [Candidatus Shapirobacteria bacterium]